MRLKSKWWWEDFLSTIDGKDERHEDHQEPIVTHPQTLMSSTSPLSFSFSNGSSSSGNPQSLLRKMRSLDNIYEVTNLIDDDVTLYYHLATSDLIVFEEEIKYGKWRIVMEEEIASIEKK